MLRDTALGLASAERRLPLAGHRDGELRLLFHGARQVVGIGAWADPLLSCCDAQERIGGVGTESVRLAMQRGAAIADSRLDGGEVRLVSARAGHLVWVGIRSLNRP